nr:hypothetical protein [Methylobacterium sp. BTF04]
MIFALGFLAASLCALLLLPAVNARAARLSRRRIEARLPLSVTEVAAEKDYLRAQFAVAQRRLERKVETTRANRHADMAAIGARTLEIAALARTVEEREAAMRERDAVIAETRATLGGVEHDLETTRSDSAIGVATLQVLEEAHRDVIEDLRAIRHMQSAVVEMQQSGTEVPLDPIVAPAPIMDQAALFAEREALRTSLAAAEEALAQALAQRDGETDDLRRRITEVADMVMQRDHLPKATVFPISARS